MSRAPPSQWPTARTCTAWLVPLTLLACEPVPLQSAPDHQLSVDFGYATLAVGRTIPIAVGGPDQAANAAAPILLVVRDRAGNWVFGQRPAYTSSDPRVATVSAAGEIRAVAPGSATVTARLGQASVPILVTVERPYTITLLSDPADAESRALDVNSSGQVVGWFRRGAETRAFLWHQGRRADLGPGIARAVNDSGVVVGESGGRVVRWRQGSALQLYADADLRGTATDVNGPGSVVGTLQSERCVRGNCGWRALVIRNGEVQVLSHRLPEASGVNDGEQVVGWFNDPNLNTQAFVYQDGRFSPLSPESLISRAHAINHAGRVVGRRMIGMESGGYEAVQWEPNGTPVALGRFRRGNLSSATSLNRSGVVVGWGNVCPNNCPDQVALRWRDGGIAALQDLVSDPDWFILEATAINDRDQIAGYGRHRSGGAIVALLLTR